MLSTIISAGLLGACAVNAAPFKFPLPNGFPDIKIPSAALTAIEKQAHGTLPNGPLLKHLSSADITNFEVISTNEQFEVAFYTSLIANITNGVSGFEVPAGQKAYILEALTAIQGQEELHALGANAILETAGASAVQPCEYMFPTTNFKDAISFAREFTDVVLGTLQSVQLSFAETGDEDYIPLIGSIIAQEGQQVGYFRSLLDLVPSELPFLTVSSGPFAYSVLNQLVLVPGTCPSAKSIDVPVFDALTVVTPPSAKTGEVTFSFEATGGYSTSSFYLTYVNQQNLPVVEKPKNIKKSGSTVTFEALFPYDEYLMNGLTIAAVTKSAGPFSDVTAVSDATLAGPGLIEIN